MTNNHFFGWACDYQRNSGEGKLARLFLQNELRQSKENILLLTNSGTVSYTHLTLPTTPYV